MEIRNIEVPLYNFLKIITHKRFQTDSSPRPQYPLAQTDSGGFFTRSLPTKERVPGRLLLQETPIIY